MFRNTFTAIISFTTDFSVLALLTEVAGMHYLLSSVFGFSAGAVTSYIISVTWVFGKKRVNNRTMEFALFTFIGLAGLGLNVAMLWFLTEVVSIHYLLSKVIASVVIFFWNFFARKHLLFR